MTKKEMVYDIVSYTHFCNLNERDVENVIRKARKERVEEVYNKFLNDKDHAAFYYSVL